MIERAIIMQAESVRAILEGRKTKTRRVIKPQPPADAINPFATMIPEEGDAWGNSGKGGNRWEWRFDREREDGSRYKCGMLFSCPYGKVGDRLWVKETWAAYNTGRYDRPEMGVFFRADDDSPRFDRGKWRSSIFMPRIYSRITLEICSVRAERVQEISEQDAYAEGCLAVCGPGMAIIKNCREIYRELWDKINGKKHPWSGNDWVWAIGFRKVEV